MLEQKLMRLRGKSIMLPLLSKIGLLQLLPQCWAARLKASADQFNGIAKNNHGKFPDAHVIAILQFGADVPADGS